jgi:hypothetical protein
MTATVAEIAPFTSTGTINSLLGGSMVRQRFLSDCKCSYRLFLARFRCPPIFEEECRGVSARCSRPGEGKASPDSAPRRAGVESIRAHLRVSLR